MMDVISSEGLVVAGILTTTAKRRSQRPSVALESAVWGTRAARVVQ